MKATAIPWKSPDIRTPLFLLLFAVAMFVTSVGCGLVWEFTLPGNVYLNTDDGDGGGYLNPGGWVGSHGTFPVVTLKQLTQDTPMSHPDELKEGWTISRLLVVWWCMFGSSVAMSVWLAFLPWTDLPSAAWRMFRKCAMDAGRPSV